MQQPWSNIGHDYTNKLNIQYVGWLSDNQTKKFENFQLF